MTKIIDLTYSTSGYFTSFLPETPEGQVTWNQIAAQTDGTGKIDTMFLKQTLYQLRKAGYKVYKEKKTTITETDQELLASLGLA